MNNKNNRLLCIVGPTATGKTALAVKIAKKFGGEIVGADSMQIYKGITIASAAPSEEEKEGIRHHLTEFLEPEQSFTVADYTDAAHHAVSDIQARGKLPILVGGTGLYVNSLVDNIKFSGGGADKELRDRIESEFDSLGGEIMLEKLRKIDPKTAANLHENDRRRIVRALELYLGSGITLSRQNELSKREASPYITLMLGLNYTDRELLYQRINRRVDIMLENGLEKEAERAFERSGGGSVQAIGHKEFFPYFRGEITLDEAVENLKRATRRYAKRQLTWFNRDSRIHWIYPDRDGDVFLRACEIIGKEDFL